MPNEFWPETPAPPFLSGGIGNAIQQKTAANNPDIFCKSQGSGYRLPSVGEMHAQTKSLSPGSSYQPQLPGHWSQYVNNDIASARRPDDASRNTNGSLYNEWGDVSKYSNGWEPGNYWTTEISVLKNGYPLPNVGGYGRILFVGTGGTAYGPTDYYAAVRPALTHVNNLFNVACVRDLVPTPSTPTPSKS